MDSFRLFKTVKINIKVLKLICLFYCFYFYVID